MVTECGQQLQPTHLSDDDVDANNVDNYFCRLWLFSQIMKISSSNPPTSLWWRCGLMCLQKLDLEYCNPSSCNPHTSLMEMWIGDGCKILQLTSLMEMVLNDASMKHCYAPNFYNDYRTCNQVRFPNPLFPGGDPVNCNPASSLETMIARIVDDLCTILTIIFAAQPTLSIICSDDDCENQNGPAVAAHLPLWSWWWLWIRDPLKKMLRDYLGYFPI